MRSNIDASIRTNSTRIKRIDQLDAELIEIMHIAGGNGRSMCHRNRGNEGIHFPHSTPLLLTPCGQLSVPRCSRFIKRKNPAIVEIVLDAIERVRQVLSLSTRRQTLDAVM